MKNLKKKLASTRGESLVEAMAACLIVAVAISMVAQVMVSAAKSVQTSRELQEKNDSIMEAFWKATETAAPSPAPSPVPGTTKFVLEGGKDSFTVPAQLYAYEVRTPEGATDAEKATIYEFAGPTPTASPAG